MERLNTTVLSLDLSFTSTGWCVVSSYDDTTLLYGEIKTKKADFDDDICRCVEILKQILAIISDSQPDIIAIEDVFQGPNAKTNKKLAQLGGIVRANLKLLEIHYIDVHPKTLKKYICGEGKGNATKQMMMDEVNRVLDADIKSDNICDAIGLSMYLVKEVYDASHIFNEILQD
jgi:crossover junction endodeoxyribonuclease RuvC